METKGGQKSFRGVRRRWLFIILALGLIAITSTIGWYFFQEKKKALPDTEDVRYAREIEQIKKPENAVEQVDYFLLLGSAYLRSNQLEKAVDAFKQADGLITDRSVETGLSVNLQLADTYLRLNDKKHATDYYNREISRLQQGNSTDNKDSIEYIRKKVSEIEKK